MWQFDNRWFLIMSRLFFPNQSAVIYKYKGLNILIDQFAGDANGAREVLTSNMYRKYLGVLSKEKKLNVLDLGSNNGGFPLLIKSEGFQIAKVVCLELNPKTAIRLKFNIEHNFESNAFALNQAICGSNRILSINLSEGGANDNIFNNYQSTDTNNFQVTGKTFNNIFTEFFADEIIDICKMDIEGAEFEVFSNDECSKIINCRQLLIEIHQNNENNRTIIQDKLKSFGFEEIDGENKVGNNHFVHSFVNKAYL